ncbi:MAG: protein kinase [Eubacteriales bacterium]
MDDSKQYIGSIFDNRYRIERVVGMGGMAFVYEATDCIYGKKVAIKLLKDKFSDDTRAVKRFINESKAVTMLDHPNIVKVNDISVQSEHKFIVMEYINGITLRKYMNYKLPLDWREALEFTEQILLALDHAHMKGIIHRDIKPQNIMIMQGGKVKVMDFGIAKIPKSESLTLVDKAIGTVYYISPEQSGGRKIDARADIYSLGVMLYEMVTGKLPFTADDPVAVIYKHINDAPVSPMKLNPNIPKGLEQIILIAMEKNPQNRYQSAAQMLRHIRRLKIEPSTVFIQPKPAPRTPTSEMSINRTSRPNRDTTEFDFVLNKNGDKHAPQAPAEQKRPVSQTPKRPAEYNAPSENQSANKPGEALQYHNYRNGVKQTGGTIPVARIENPEEKRRISSAPKAPRTNENPPRTQVARPNNPQGVSHPTSTPANRQGAGQSTAQRTGNTPRKNAKKRSSSSYSAILLVLIITLIVAITGLIILITTMLSVKTPSAITYISNISEKALIYLRQGLL